MLVEEPFVCIKQCWTWVAIISRRSTELCWTLSIYYYFQFDSPIESVWHIHNSNIEKINLFDQKYVSALSEKPTENVHYPQIPTMYIGTYQQQLYIQESTSLQHDLEASMDTRNVFVEGNMPRIEWKPFIATGEVMICLTL